MSTDTYSFPCDLNGALPAEMQAMLSVSDDGEHIVVNMSQHAEDAGREIYLTPEQAGNLASLLDVLTGAADPDEPEVPGRMVVTVGVVLIVALILGIVNPFIAVMLTR